jgi:hypothetical protein
LALGRRKRGRETKTINDVKDEINIKKKFWEEIIAYFPLIRHGPHRKRSRCLATIRGLLPSRCLAMTGGYTHTHTRTAT